MLLLLVNVLMFASSAPSCLTNYGKTACGYHCLAAHGQVACAKTPAGVCSDISTAVACWDPPDWVRAHYGDKTPRPECRRRGEKHACGYHCTAHGDDVACAQSPDGICDSSSRGVTCWDPTPSTYCADDQALPRPGCIKVNGVIACGYACEARSGMLACARTPAGKCTVQPREIVCVDPEPPPMCGARPCTPDGPESPRWWCRPKEPPR